MHHILTGDLVLEILTGDPLKSENIQSRFSQNTYFANASRCDAVDDKRGSLMVLLTQITIRVLKKNYVAT